MTSFYPQAIYLVIGSLFGLLAVAVIEKTDKEERPLPFPVEMERTAKTLLVISVVMAWPLFVISLLVYAVRRGEFRSDYAPCLTCGAGVRDECTDACDCAECIGVEDGQAVKFRGQER